MKLLRSAGNKTTKNKYGENVPHIEITEAVLVHCNIVNNDYLQETRFLYTFGSLLEISPKIFTFLKTFNSKFQAIEV